MPTLAQIQEEIGNMLELVEGDPTDIDAVAPQMTDIQAYIAELMQSRADKVDAIGQFIKLSTGKAEALEEEGKRLIANAKAMKIQVERLRDYCADFMQANNFQKVKGNLYTLSLRKSESVFVDAMDTLETARPDLVKTEIRKSPDKVAIKNAIKNGEAVPGCELVTRESLQVR